MKNKSIDDIFEKYTDEQENTQNNDGILSKEEILESIPKNALKSINNDLAKIHIEWRWRIFEIPNREHRLIEISFKKPNDKRMYIDKNGKWINSEVGEEYNQFVVDEYYTYS